MVDLGCHAGHGVGKNVSDALLFLRYFNHTGSLIIVADAFEDFVLDVLHRLREVPPYARMGVNATGVFAALHRRDDLQMDLRGLAQTWVACCAGVWCGWGRRETGYCRITRQRLGLDANLTHSLPVPPSSAPDGLFAQLLRASSSAAEPAGQRRARPRPYVVPSLRADTLWRRHGRGRRIDLIKVDVDLSWKQIGLEGLLDESAFSVMVIEVDAAWGGVLRPWNVSALDQLAWLARKRGYNSYLKVRCRAAASAQSELRMEPNASNWYFPLAEIGAPFRPTRYHARLRPTVFIQDVVLLDASQPELRALPAIGKAECYRSKIALFKFPTAL